MPDIASTSSANRVVVPATTSSATAGTQGPSRLGKQDFLQLLMAQLRNQDPLKPMEDTAMIAQMAQFSALEATQHLSSVIEKSTNMQTVTQAASLVGKYVEAMRADGTAIDGLVSGVTFTSSDGLVAPMLSVDGEDVDYGSVLRVSANKEQSLS
jgi:flagellar basal-body rod modification protein FlgD